MNKNQINVSGVRSQQCVFERGGPSRNDCGAQTFNNLDSKQKCSTLSVCLEGTTGA